MANPTPPPTSSVPRGPKQGLQAGEARISLLIQGAPGAGKTLVGSHFPGLYVFDFDRGFAPYAARFSKARYYDDYCALDKEVPPRAFKQFCEGPESDFEKALRDPECQTIMVDTVAGLQQSILEWSIYQRLKGAVAKSNLAKPERDDYGWALQFGLRTINAIKASGKNLIVTAHEDIADDDVVSAQGALRKKVLPRTVGSLKHDLAKHFRLYWGIEAVFDPVAKRTRHYLTTQPSQFGRDFKTAYDGGLFPERMDITGQDTYALIHGPIMAYFERLRVSAVAGAATGVPATPASGGTTVAK